MARTVAASICVAVGHRSSLPLSSNPPQHHTPEVRPQSCMPPDPVGSCPDLWPPAGGTTGEASAADDPPRPKWSRAAAESPWREKRVAPPLSLGPHGHPEAPLGGGTTEEEAGEGAAAAARVGRLASPAQKSPCTLCCPKNLSGEYRTLAPSLVVC
jgi:hypothetical protein